MAFDKVIDSAKLDTAMTATANAIRSKSGKTDNIVWDETSGFKSAVEAIEMGGGADPVLQEKTVIPTKADQNITPDSGYDGLAKVLVKGDDDFIAANIKSGVSIFGVVGNFVGEASGGGELVYASGTFSSQNTSGAGVTLGSVSELDFEPQFVLVWANGENYVSGQFKAFMGYYNKLNSESGGLTSNSSLMMSWSQLAITVSKNGFTVKGDSADSGVYASSYNYIALGVE